MPVAVLLNVEVPHITLVDAQLEFNTAANVGVLIVCMPCAVSNKPPVKLKLAETVALAICFKVPAYNNRLAVKPDNVKAEKVGDAVVLISCTVSNVFKLNVKLVPNVTALTTPATAPKIPANNPGPTPKVKPLNCGELLVCMFCTVSNKPLIKLKFADTVALVNCFVPFR